MIRGLYISIDGPDENINSSVSMSLLNSLSLEGRNVIFLDEPDLKQINNYSDVKLSYAEHLATLTALLEKIKLHLEKGTDCIVTYSLIKSLSLYYYTQKDPIDYMSINGTINTIMTIVRPDVEIILNGTDSSTNASKIYAHEALNRGIPAINNYDDFGATVELIKSHLIYRRSSIPSGENNIPQREVRLPIKLMKMSKGEKMEKSENKPKAVMPDEENDWLDSAVTDQDGPVYALTEELGQIAAAAAMARLSRRAGDLRDTLVEEFSEVDTKKDIAVLRRIISDYGDDSVTQLVGVHYVVEGASNLLTKQLEWGRLAAYLEQSTRYIYYDRKDSDGKYLYLRPPGIEKKVIMGYETIMDKIYDNYSVVVRTIADHLNKKMVKPEEMGEAAWNNVIRGQACDAARPMLPVATKSTVGVFASGQALENMIMRMRASELPEARETAEKILQETRKVMPVFLERTDKENRGGAYTKYLADKHKNMQELADKILPPNYDTEYKFGPTLTSYSPKNELDLVAHMLYEYTDLSEDQLNDLIKTMSYEDKYQVLKTYTGERRNRRHKPGRALERAVYSWDIMSDYGSFRDLQRHRMVSDLAWQKLTPRYGYDIPELVEECELTDLFEEAFDLSLELHSLLQAAGYEEESQYATLLGHNMRWKITMNAREAMHFMELRTSAQGHPGYRKIAKEMYEQLAAVHPLIAETMNFINQQDSPELTRLDEELRNEKRRK